jgi:hypothetical protein
MRTQITAGHQIPEISKVLNQKTISGDSKKMADKEGEQIVPHGAEGACSDSCRDLYHRDYYTWALGQGQALRARKIEALDWENLAEEVESLGRSEARELESRLEGLLLHLLKWRYQPNKRSRSWRLTVREQRRRVERVLNQNPGLKPTLAENLTAAYEVALLMAARETRLEEPTFPPECPWDFEQIMDADFWPEN